MKNLCMILMTVLFFNCSNTEVEVVELTPQQENKMQLKFNIARVDYNLGKAIFDDASLTKAKKGFEYIVYERPTSVFADSARVYLDSLKQY